MYYKFKIKLKIPEMNSKKITKKELCLYLFALIFIVSGKTFGKSNQSPYQIKKIVIDAGHGGKDPGCIGTCFKTKEKDVTLQVALEFGQLIKENYPNVEIVFTRNKDVFVELDERTKIANETKADLFISIHCNAMPKGNEHFRGTETYIMGTTMNSEVVKRENAVILLENNYQNKYEGYNQNTPEGKILLHSFQTGFQKASLNLANIMEDELHAMSNFPSKGVKQAGLLVLRKTACPSILVEIGFLTNRIDESYLSQKEGQSKVALALFKGFIKYKMSVENYQSDDKLYTVKGVTNHKTMTKIEKEEEKIENPIKKSNLKIKPITPQLIFNSKNKFNFAIQLESVNVKNQNRIEFWEKQTGYTVVEMIVNDRKNI